LRRMNATEAILEMTAPNKRDLTEELAGRVSRAAVIRRDEPLAKHTTLRVGGPADVYVEPAAEADLVTVVRLCGERGVPCFIIGRGSNLLVRDGGFRGVIICLSHQNFSRIEVVGERLRCGAGARLKNVAVEAKRSGLSGVEFLEGIPGSVGGALRMNAGANGGETKDVLIEAVGIDRDGKRHVFSNAEMKFVYRASGVDPSIIFTSARFRGTIAAPDAIRARMMEVQNHRETAQPIREKTGGSTFKNPPGHSAWKLVDAAGCRGLRLGGAQVSEMHCNFLINTGDATANDIETLGETVRQRVRDNCGIELQWEIKRIGIAA